jgi:hypothetical protein
VLVGLGFNSTPYLRRVVLVTPHDRCGPFFYRPRGNILPRLEMRSKSFFEEIWGKLSQRAGRATRPLRILARKCSGSGRLRFACGVLDISSMPRGDCPQTLTCAPDSRSAVQIPSPSSEGEVRGGRARPSRVVSRRGGRGRGNVTHVQNPTRNQAAGCFEEERTRPEARERSRIRGRES